MDHSTADESGVAVADLPSTSGAHWANRDKDVLQRRTAGQPTPFRRPPAVNSFGDGASAVEADTSDIWDAFAPTGKPDAAHPAEGPAAAWEAVRNPVAASADPSAFRPPRRNPADLPAGARRDPGDLPAGSGRDPGDLSAGSGRASFGVTDGPISGARPEPVSPAAPRPPAGDQPSVGRVPVAGGVPAFADLRAPGGDSITDGGVGAGNGGAGNGGAVGAYPPAADWTPRERASDHWTPGGSADHQASGPVPGDASGDVPGGIGDVIGGRGREIRPHRAGDSSAQRLEPRRSRFATAASVLLIAVVLVGGAVAGVTYFGEEDQSLTSVLKLGSGDADSKVATAPLDGRTAASFELVAATTKVSLRTQDLGDQLFRITSAGDSGTAPSPVLSENRVQLLLSPDGEGASGNVEVLLSAKVVWGLRFVGGTDEQVVDVTGGKVSSIDIAGGSRRVDLRLSQPTGTVPVRVTGAVDELSVLSPAGSPVRVKVDSGAKTVAAGDKTLRDVRPGSTLTPKDWRAPNRYDVDAASRVTLLTVRNAP